MALIMAIMKTIAQPISELTVWLEETYNVPSSETIAKWHLLTGMNITIKDTSVACEPVDTIDVPTTKTTTKTMKKNIPRTKDLCQHIFVVGAKAGEQCTTKPKGGATHCSAHKPKNSIVKDKTTKTKAKKEKVKSVEKIDSDFDADTDEEKVEVKEEVEPKKNKTEKSSKKVEKKPKRAVVDSDFDHSDNEENYFPVKPLLKKKGKGQPKKAYNTDDETLDDDLDLSDN
jgi:hypothetical protein